VLLQKRIDRFAVPVSRYSKVLRRCTLKDMFGWSVVKHGSKWKVVLCAWMPITTEWAFASGERCWDCASQSLPDLGFRWTIGPKLGILKRVYPSVLSISQCFWGLCALIARSQWSNGRCVHCAGYYSRWKQDLCQKARKLINGGRASLRKVNLSQEVGGSDDQLPAEETINPKSNTPTGCAYLKSSHTGYPCSSVGASCAPAR
jgi:hypothetical protein